MADKPEFLSATSIMSDQVRNPEGEDLGTIEELMIDLCPDPRLGRQDL